MEAIKANVEKQLASLTYTGEMPCYNSETYVSKHLQAHLDTKKADEKYKNNKSLKVN
jgi:hypothetical protein